MPKKDPKLDPSTVSAAYAASEAYWAQVSTILDGTEAMRTAGERYLPQHTNEKEQRYLERLESAVLYNATELTLESWVGRPFSDPINVGEDVPDEVQAYLEDVDLQGNAAGVFARNWFREGLAKGLAHVLVDFPAMEDEEVSVRSRADDLRENRRPYWCFVQPENLIFASAVVENGREVLTHVRIKETEVSRVGFCEEIEHRIRIWDRILPGEMPDRPELAGLEPGVYVSLWALRRAGKSRRAEWELVENPRLVGIPEIPLVTFYAHREELMKGRSPLEGLVDLNIRHWQSLSDQINILTAGRFPLLALSGGSEEDSIITIGPWKVLFTPDPKGKFYYVEHSGAAIGAGRDDLQDLEEKMAAYGADFLRKKPGSLTATARALDSAEATSPLQDAVIIFNDALSRVMEYMAMWEGRDELGTISVSSDFGPEEFVRGDVDAIKEARKLRDLSRRRFLEELKRRGALADEFDFDENDRELEDETGEIGGEAISGDIDPEAEE
jgi:hypothetical protein